jgi:hypothetical protein
MKTKCYVFFVVFIFFSLQTFCQKNPDFKINVGGQSIMIPPPDTGFVEVGDTIRKMFDTYVDKQNVLKAFYLHTDNIKKIGIEPINTQKLKYAVITVVKSAENTDFSENDFIEFKKILKDTIPRNLPDYKKNADQILLKLKDIIGKQEIGKLVPLATAIDIENAYGFIIFTTINSGYGLQNAIGGSLTMRLKNRILNFNVYSYQINEESLAWVYNTIQVWSLLLSLSNEELATTTNSSSNNAQDYISTNKILNLFTEMANGIFMLFKGLITKTPVTFVCSIILVLLYYITTRKLLPTYLKKNHSPIYLYFKKVSDFITKRSLPLTILVLFELFSVLVIIILLIKLIGLPVPTNY